MIIQNEIADPSKSGPHLKIPIINPAKRKAFLDTVVDLASTKRQGLKKLGPFSIAPARDDDDCRYFCQVRSIPSSGFGGCEFRFDVPLQATIDEDPATRAKWLVESASRFNELTGLTKYTRQTREMIDKSLRPASGGLVPPRLVAIGLTPFGGGRGIGFSTTVDVEVLGRDLKPGIDRIKDSDHEELEGKLARLVEEHLKRERVRNLAIASRAMGWIDEAALLILDASGFSRSKAISLLREQRLLEFDFGGDDGGGFQAALYWDDGVIKGDIESFIEGWRFEADELTITNHGLPQTILLSCPGRRLGEIVDIPFVPADALITSVKAVGNLLYFNLVIGRRLIDEAAGEPLAQERIG